jgi:ABC-type Zn uptake system ZnuABC Zn-binding protein ZnuA
MKNVIQWLAAATLLWGMSGCAAAGNASAATGPDNRLKVASTVSPVTNIIYNVGGDKIDLTGIIPEGTDSHTFEPAPSDAKTLAQADVIFVNGLHLEDPTVKLAQANLKPGGEIVDLGSQTITPDQYVFDFSFPKANGSPNPHLWMNPMYAKRYAEIVRDTLSRRDPGDTAYYSQNYTAFAARIDAIDGAIQAAINSIPPNNRKLLTYHDSFAYFAPRYGITVIGAIQPADFAEPSAREVAQIIEQIKQEKVPAIFGSEVFPSPVLAQIAKESGAAYVDSLRDDDLPGKTGDADHSYLGLMVDDVTTMTRALGGDPSNIDSFNTANVPGSDSSVNQQQ